MNKHPTPWRMLLRTSLHGSHPISEYMGMIAEGRCSEHPSTLVEDDPATIGALLGAVREAARPVKP